MPVTLTLVETADIPTRNGGLLRLGIFTGVWDNSYATGGETADFAAWFRRLLSVKVTENSVFGSGVVFDVVETNFGVGTCLVEVNRQGVHTHALHLNQADVADGATTRVNAGTNLLGANTGADIAVAGVVDALGVGGIVQAAQANAAEVTAAVDLSTLEARFEVWGYV